MKRWIGDIWKLQKKSYIVIPTNIGWRVDGSNIMGRGLAQQAAVKYPELPGWYGGKCQEAPEGKLHVYEPGKLVMFPVKPLNREKPWLSWKSKADIELIIQSASQLFGLPFDDPVSIPLVGCGNGGLDPAEVIPVLSAMLVHERFTLIFPPSWKDATEERKRT